MAKAYEFLANGFEDIEALAPVDILRRGGVEVKTVSISNSLMVKSANGITVKADLLFDEVDDFFDADILMLPGGMPGAANLNLHEGLRKLLVEQNEKGERLGAICAAPMVLGSVGVLRGKHATCYPGFEKRLTGAEYTGELCTIDGNITTGKGPAAAFIYGFAILEQLTSAAIAKDVKDGMLVSELIKLH